MEGPSARLRAMPVLILTRCLLCLPLAEVAPVARRHHQSPPTISPLLSACLDSTIDHITQLNLVHLNSPWFISTQHFNSTWSVSTQHLNLTFQFNLATQRPTTWLNGTAGRTWLSSTVWLGSPAQRYSWRIQHTPQTTTHKPHTTHHKPQTTTHTTHTTHHTPHTTSHKQPTSSFPPVAITHMTAERRGQIPTGGFSGSGTSPGSQVRETACDVRGVHPHKIDKKIKRVRTQ